MKFTTLFFALFLVVLQFSSSFAQNDNLQKVSKLHDEKNYGQVLKVIDPVLIEYKNVPAYLSKLHFIRGSARFNSIYAVRTGGVFGSDKVFDEKRSRFEITYLEPLVNQINGALGDFEQAIVYGQASTKIARKNDGNDPVFTYDQNFETGILNLKALTHLEKAQFVTNSYADFSAAAMVFSELDTIHDTNITRFGGKFGDDNTRVKSGEMLAAEIRTKVALGEIEAAYTLFNKWQKANGYRSLKKDLGIPAMIEALDLVGNYKYAEAFLVREAIRQISLDKGNVVPANLAIHKAAMKSHLYNMNFAVVISPTGKLLPFQRARLAAAYSIKPAPTPAESVFIKLAPNAIKIENKENSPFDVQLNAIRFKLQSTDKKESDAGRQTLDEMFKKDATNAAILSVRGYAAMLKENFAAAELDLSAAIKKDPFLAFAHGAFQNRAAVYRKLGKVDLAAKDEKDHDQFRKALALLAAE
jgi:tetratricopeptide (TPR) repeat protein